MIRAAVCPQYGPPEVVRIEERRPPTLDAGQVLVRVSAASINYPDVLIVANRYQISVPPPFVAGSEFAGIVVETADEAGDLVVGDRVRGMQICGAFAEQVAVPARSLARIPDGVDDRRAAAFGVAYRTAYHALRSQARLKPGDAVIVLGAGGGVGLAAVSLALLLGADVTAVASSAEKLDAAVSCGAQHIVNHSACDLRTALREVLPDGADAVIDPVGGDLSEPALRSLRRGGRFVTVGYASGVIPRIPLNLILVKGVTVLGFHLRDVPHDEFVRNEAELQELFVAGVASPHIGAVYPLAQTASALRHVADGRAVGKVVIDVS